MLLPVKQKEGVRSSILEICIEAVNKEVDQEISEHPLFFLSPFQAMC